MHQSSLSRGTLVRWTKGFENSGVINQDVAILLSKAMSKNNVSLLWILNHHFSQSRRLPLATNTRHL